MAEALEREGETETALLLYAGCGYPEARVRLALVSAREGRYEQVSSVVQAALCNQPTDAEAQRLERIAARVRKHESKPNKARKKTVHECTALRLPCAPSTRVELVVRDHLTQPDAPAFYVENSLICSLFGLLCWEAIYEPVRGAFFHPFHAAPADWASPEFAARRMPTLTRCLARLEDGTYQAHIMRAFTAKFGTLSRFVHWRAIDERLLQLSLQCIQPAHIRLYCLRLLQRLVDNCTGLPDLIQFDLDRSTYKMIEVKGPGDRLQDHQKRWLMYCREHQLPMEVCHVSWPNESRSSQAPSLC